MFDRKRAAEFFVVAWCKNWTLRRYLLVVTETEANDWVAEETVAALHEACPWVPKRLSDYLHGRTVRSQVQDNYQKLSDWLWAQKTDVGRLRCAAQIERLRDLEISKKIDRPAKTNADYVRVMRTASIVRDIQKSTQRGAWNVCKA